MIGSFLTKLYGRLHATKSQGHATKSKRHATKNGSMQLKVEAMQLKVDMQSNIGEEDQQRTPYMFSHFFL